MVFAQVQTAQKPRSQSAQIVAWVYAGVLILVSMAQLFEFENFVPLFRDMAFPGGDGTGTLLACLIVFMQVFSIPYLLRMPLSVAMRWCGLAFSLLVPIMWLGIAVWVLTGAPDSAMNAGLLGTKIMDITAVQQIIGAVVLFTLAVWSAYGLWPHSKK